MDEIRTRMMYDPIYLSFMVAGLIEAITGLLMLAVVCANEHHPMQWTDKRDVLGIFAYGTSMAGLVVASHFIPWPQW